VRRPRVLLLGNFKKPGVLTAMRTAEAELAPWARLERRDLSQQVEDERVRAAFALVLGGDGAILAAARRVAKAGVPLLGVHIGKLGFLAEIKPDELAPTLAKLRSGIPEPIECTMLRAEVYRRGKLLRRCTAVNDAVVSRQAFNRVIEMTLFIDGEKVNTFRADGLICSTPVGSTAHSLAAGGPIIEPHARVMVISPICPHTLSNRPLVIPSKAVVEVEVWSRSVGFALTADGQVMVKLRNHDRIRVRRNPWPLRLLKVSGRSFFETLRTKLHWEGSTSDAASPRA